jgi:hypothetical protein
MELFAAWVLIFSLFFRGKKGKVCIFRKHDGLASSACAARASLEKPMYFPAASKCCVGKHHGTFCSRMRSLLTKGWDWPSPGRTLLGRLKLLRLRPSLLSPGQMTRVMVLYYLGDDRL